jgi:Domain of unknown function (DUF4192)
MRTARPCLDHRHRRADTEPARLVRRGGHHSTSPQAADDDRSSTQGGLVALLDSCEEGVEIHVQDRRMCTHPRIVDVVHSGWIGPRRTSPGDRVFVRMSTTAEPHIVARRPEDVLATIPYLLGFHPHESLVVVALRQPRHRVVCAIRLDLPSRRSSPAVAAQLLVGLRNCAASSALVVVYSDTESPGRCVGRVVAASLRDGGLDVLALWRADGSRWWSYATEGRPCRSGGEWGDRGCDCSSSEGTPYDNRYGPCSAQAVLEGMEVLPDRVALARRVAPQPAEQRATAAELTARVRADLLAQSSGQGQAAVVMAGQLVVERFVRTFLASPRPLSDVEVAELSVWLGHVDVRDVAWCLIDRSALAAHLDLWQQLTRRAAPGFVAAPAALLAFAAWQSGQGALAQCALDRVFADDSGYSLGLLIAEALADGLPPSSWTSPALADVRAAVSRSRHRTPRAASSSIGQRSGRRGGNPLLQPPDSSC